MKRKREDANSSATAQPPIPTHNAPPQQPQPMTFANNPPLTQQQPTPPFGTPNLSSDTSLTQFDPQVNSFIFSLASVDSTDQAPSTLDQLGVTSGPPSSEQPEYPTTVSDEQQYLHYRAWTLDMIEAIKIHYPQYAPEIPGTLPEIYGLYVTLDQYLSECQATPSTNAEQQKAPVPDLKAETKPTDDIPPTRVSETELAEKLGDCLMGKIVQDQEKKSRVQKRDLKQGVDLDASKRMVRTLASGYVMEGNRNGAHELVSFWNAYAPEYRLTKSDVGLPSEFVPSQQTATVEKPFTQTFNLEGQSYELQEKGGVKGGFHRIFDAPDNYPTRALVRAPKEKPQQSIEAGMRNLLKVKQWGFGTPAIYNKPEQELAYVVEYIPDGFDMNNREQRDAVADAFRLMIQTKGEFPFDLRVDNIRFKGNKLVVIDFSEGGAVLADPAFAKDSLLEFCWKGTKTGKPREFIRQNTRLQTLLDNAYQEGRLPQAMSRNAVDYDSALCDLILNKLKQEEAAALLAPGEVQQY
jgi:hypothetical protein